MWLHFWWCFTTDSFQAPPLPLQFCLLSGQAHRKARGLPPLDLGLVQTIKALAHMQVDRNAHSSPALTATKGKSVPFPCSVKPNSDLLGSMSRSPRKYLNVIDKSFFFQNFFSECVAFQNLNKILGREV